MTSLYGVQTVFTTASKYYKYAVNSFHKRVLVISERDRDVFTQEVCVTPKALQIEDVNLY